jgi:hypothetical protein
MSDNLTASEVEELKRLEAVAAPPPWRTDGDSPRLEGNYDICTFGSFIHVAEQCRANRDLIAKIRPHIPALLRAWDQRGILADLVTNSAKFCTTAERERSEVIEQRNRAYLDRDEISNDLVKSRAECEKWKEAIGCIKLLSTWAGKTAPTVGLDEAIDAARETVDELMKGTP